MKRIQGFTLIEMLLSVACLGIILGMTVPAYRLLQTRNDLDVAMITLQRDEIAEASWVKISDISNVLQALIEQGVGVDNWTHIAVSEFEDVLKTFDGEAVDLPEIVID
jgi:prepilin-type N-terminal cleavage/methylation domain-containing protein